MKAASISSTAADASVGTSASDRGCVPPAADDQALGRLGEELISHGVEQIRPELAPAARRVSVLRPVLNGRSLQVWVSHGGTDFLVGLGISVGCTSRPAAAAERIVARLQNAEDGRRW